MKKPIVLIIMDGYGMNPAVYGNAVKAACTPNLDKYFASCPNTVIGASGLKVGLPDGQMGNSEVGHTNIGAGRIVYQELTRITKAISDGDFYTNPVFSDAVKNCKINNSSLHLMGLLSDGGVHSHNTHLYALLKLAKDAGLKDVNIHCFMDGRDVPPTSGIDFIKDLQSQIDKIGVGRIATIEGRYFAMDRELKWDRVAKTYAAMVYGEGDKFASPVNAVQASYDEDITDEFIKPAVIEGASRVKENDSIIFFNFRPDRAREITRAFVDDDFTGFERIGGRQPVYFVCMTQYDAVMPNVNVAFKPQELDHPIGEIVSKAGLKQLRIAEYTKYAHVTFFLNGGEEVQYDGEDRILVDSPDVATYDLKPEMSAYEVTEILVEAIESDKYDMIVVNYANCDMVGHTGVFDAAVTAVEAVDTCVGRVVDEIMLKGGVAIITADHGNADKMYEEDGSPFTAHTTFNVPFIIVGEDCRLKEGGCLADIAPTMLEIMGMQKPPQMTGVSLIK